MTDRESGVNVDPLGGLLLEPPNELKFKGPFDDYVTVALSIRNPTDKRIAFKIKTTAPKRYCVKPNSGVLDPSQSMKVNVLLQPFNYDPLEKNKHKFMVQYIYLNDVEMTLSVNDILNMWKDVPTSRLLDLKLKCLFEFTEAEQQRLSQLTPQNNESVSISRANNTTANNTTANTTANTLYSTASSQSVLETTASQQQQQPQTQAPKPNKSLSTTSSRTSDYQSAANDSAVSSPSSDFESSRNANKTVTSSSPAATAAAKLDKNDNLVNELKLAKQDNENLKSEVKRLKEEEQRLRKLALTSSASPASRSAAHAGESGTLDDLLNNRLLILVFVLIAIIFYLVIFR